MQMNIENSEMLDLKAELCQLKSKNLHQGQLRIQEVTSKNLQIAQLERKIKEEQHLRQVDNESKQKVIDELERDIEVTLQSQIQENDKLSQRNHEL